jgi:hypothetical protein
MTGPWSVTIAFTEVDGLDWSPPPAADEDPPLPLVKRRAPPRARTLAGVGGPKPRATFPQEIDDLSW